jgi:streptogramin lyase
MIYSKKAGLFPCVITIALTTSLLAISCEKSVNSVPNNNSSPPPDSSATPPAKKWVVSTVAGTGQPALVDGPGQTAAFNRPQCIALDQSGNIFIGDQQNFAIRRMDTSYNVTTYSGRTVVTPTFGWGNVYGMVVDNQDNLFVIEYDLVAKIASPTNVQMYAGNMTIGYMDGQGLNAFFHELGNLTIDPQRNLYVPDYDMSNIHHLRKIDTAENVTTMTLQDNTSFPDNGLPNYYYDYAVAADSSGNLFITGNGNSIVKKIDPTGTVTLFAGAGDLGLTDGQGSAAQFNTILGIATDNKGNVWVADGDNHAIREISPGGLVTTIAGFSGQPGFQDGDASHAMFNYPSGIAVDKNGIVYVADYANNKIRKLEYK